MRSMHLALNFILLENGDFFRIFRAEEYKLRACSFCTVFETGHRNMKNKIFIVFESSRFDEND